MRTRARRRLNAKAAKPAKKSALRALRSLRSIVRGQRGVRRERVSAVRIRRRRLPVARRHGDGVRQQLAGGAERAARHVVRPDRARRHGRRPRVLLERQHPCDARQPVAPQQPPLRARAARRRRHPAARRGGAVRVVDVPVPTRTATSSSTSRRSGGAAGKDVGNVGWTGRELVAFRLHLPSKITYHTTRQRRGNILVWEQPLADRLRGVPLTSMRGWRRSRFSIARSGCSARRSSPSPSCSRSLSGG